MLNFIKIVGICINILNDVCVRVCIKWIVIIVYTAHIMQGPIVFVMSPNPMFIFWMDLHILQFVRIMLLIDIRMLHKKLQLMVRIIIPQNE